MHKGARDDAGRGGGEHAVVGWKYWGVPASLWDFSRSEGLGWTSSLRGDDVRWPGPPPSLLLMPLSEIQSGTGGPMAWIPGSISLLKTLLNNLNAPSVA